MRESGLRFVGIVLGFACISIARGDIYNLGGTNQPAQDAVLTYDGTNFGIVNTLLGADTFYNAGIFGQNTIAPTSRPAKFGAGPTGRKTSRSRPMPMSAKERAARSTAMPRGSGRSSAG